MLKSFIHGKGNNSGSNSSLTECFAVTLSTQEAEANIHFQIVVKNFLYHLTGHKKIHYYGFCILS